ncbi:MAG: CZB domain-containing protein [Proteobacteria bacterium]|nr:CZB domain-containing protein [Pseudomonadota bacterium]
MLHGQENLKPEEVANHHQCAFGKWYDSPEDLGLKAFPAFIMSVNITKKFIPMLARL